MEISENKGFVALELILAIAVLSAGIVAVYTTFSQVDVLSLNVSNSFIAAYLAQEGLEIVRNVRDQNFIDIAAFDLGLTSCQSGCQADYKTGTAVETANNQLKPYNDNTFLNINSNGFYSYDAGTVTRFKRKITITQEGSDTLKINAIVMWNYSGKSFNYETTGYLYNWY